MRTWFMPPEVVEEDRGIYQTLYSSIAIANTSLFSNGCAGSCVALLCGNAHFGPGKAILDRPGVNLLRPYLESGSSAAVGATTMGLGAGPVVSNGFCVIDSTDGCDVLLHQGEGREASDRRIPQAGPSTFINQ
jgi:hypothetical protein